MAVEAPEAEPEAPVDEGYAEEGYAEEGYAEEGYAEEGSPEEAEVASASVRLSPGKPKGPRPAPREPAGVSSFQGSGPSRGRLGASAGRPGQGPPPVGPWGQGC